MSDIKFAICDDSKTDTDYLASMVSKWAKEQNCSITMQTFSSAESFLFHYVDEKDYDCLLLDIEMGVMDGVTLAKKIRKENESVQIIFITGYSDYIAEGYEVSALHYLMKPIHVEKLYAVLDRAREKIRSNEKTLILNLADEIVRLPLYEIRFIDVQKNYITYHGKQDYTIKKSLKEAEQELDERFFRVGRSCIVNLTYIRRVTKSEIYLNENFSIPLPRGMYDSLNRAIITRT